MIQENNENIAEGLSVIIPVFNEKNSVESTAKRVATVLSAQNVDYEIIAVDDGSKDGSGQLLDSLAVNKLVVIHHQENRGYGASLKTGIKSAIYPWIMLTDADGTYPIEKMPELIREAGGYDMVIGARTGQKVHDSFFRKIGRGIVRKFASYVSGHKIEDINSGLRIFKKEDAKRFWNLFPDGFSFTTTITVASLTRGHKLKYIPIDYHKRSGKSSIKPAKDFVGFLSLITRLAIYYRPLKVFTPLAIFLFVFSFAILFYSLFVLHQVWDATWAVLFISAIQIQIFGFIADMIVKRFYND